MTDTEKRRQDLLRQARQIYDSKSVIPAVHPRYEAVYEGLYGVEKDHSKSTFTIRLILAMIIFVVYAGMDMQKMSLWNYKSNDIAEAVSSNIVLHIVEPAKEKNNNIEKDNIINNDTSE